MSDWKSLYAADWKTSAAREIEISTALSAALNVPLMATGVGAGQTGRVKGYAKTPGQADYATACGRLHVEITGPLKPGIVSPLAAIWIRPDKLAAAERTLARGELTVLAHNLPDRSGPGLTRFIALDGDMLSRWRAGSFKTITKQPRGVPETYVEIPTREACSLHIALKTMQAALGMKAAAPVEIDVPVSAKTMATARPFTRATLASKQVNGWTPCSVPASRRPFGPAGVNARMSRKPAALAA